MASRVVDDGIPPGFVCTPEELAEPSAEEMLGFQVTPSAGKTWHPGRATGPQRGVRPAARYVVSFVPGGEEGRRLPQVFYRVVYPGGALSEVVTKTYLSCWHTWARINHCRPED